MANNNHSKQRKKENIMTKINKKTTTAKEVKFDLSKYPSKSAAIRDLNAKGHSRSTIAKMIDIRYQHVRNVLEMPLKRKDK